MASRLGYFREVFRSRAVLVELEWKLLRRVRPVFRLISASYRRLAIRDTRVVAVVGTFGKTTTSRALCAAIGLEPYDRIEANGRSAVARRIIATKPGASPVVVEVGINGPGQMGPQAWLVKPDVVVVTSIGSEHNRSFESLKVTRAEKFEMARALPPNGTAVLNGDDPNVQWMVRQTDRRVVTFGLGEGNDVRATEVELDWPHGTRFKLHAGGDVRTARTKLLGRTMVYPILAAVAVALTEGVALDEALAKLEHLEPSPLRLCPVRLPNGAYAIDDTRKSGEETIFAALELLAQIQAPRKTLVLGHVEEPRGSGHALYRRIGRAAAGAADRIICVGSSNSFRAIRRGATQAGMRWSSVLKAGRSPSRAVGFVQEDLHPGEVVLVKGTNVQRLARVVLALSGVPVLCDLYECQLININCETCDYLEEGWQVY